MKNVIMQNCGYIQSVEDFYDWKSGQEACSSWTGFQFAYYDSKTLKVFAFYDIEHTPKELKRGQKSVIV